MRPSIIEYYGMYSAVICKTYVLSAAGSSNLVYFLMFNLPHSSLAQEAIFLRRSEASNIFPYMRKTFAFFKKEIIFYFNP